MPDIDIHKRQWRSMPLPFSVPYSSPRRFKLRSSCAQASSARKRTQIPLDVAARMQHDQLIRKPLCASPGAVRAGRVVARPAEHRPEHRQPRPVSAAFQSQVLPRPAPDYPPISHAHRRLQQHDSIRMRHGLDEALAPGVLDDVVGRGEYLAEQRVALGYRALAVAP